MEAAGGWNTQQGTAKVKHESRDEERHGGDRGCGGGLNGQDIVAREDPSGHSQWGINDRKKMSTVSGTLMTLDIFH